jgi:drug/metabolite transporter (DMT)-like permease
VSVVGPSRSAVFMNFQPVVGVLLATTLLKEGLTGWDVAGGALVLVGVALTTRERKSVVEHRADGEVRRGPSRPPPT